MFYFPPVPKLSTSYCLFGRSSFTVGMFYYTFVRLQPILCDTGRWQYKQVEFNVTVATMNTNAMIQVTVRDLDIQFSCQCPDLPSELDMPYDLIMM